MKPRLALFLTLALSALLAPFSSRAQSGEPAVVAPSPLRSAEELDHLLGPVALYPDALLAIVLPASTKPVDIVMAIRYLQGGGSLNAIERQPWDDSVRALAHQRDALEFLDDNLLWTRDLAEAFTAQPAEVMQSIQRLRRAALNAGTLRDSPQHKLIVTADQIRIVPADPDIIYVPRYDTRVVYVERPIYRHQPLVTFGDGFSVGSWLNYDCDWHHRRIYVSDRSWRWHSRPAWRLSRFHHGPSFESHHWRPWSHSHRYHRPTYAAPEHPHHFTEPVHRPAPRYENSPRHDRRDHGRRDNDRHDHDRRDNDDSRRREEIDRRDHTPRFQPQSVTAAPAAVTRTPRVAPHVMTTDPVQVTRVPVISQPAPVNPRRFRGSDEDRHPEVARPDIPRLAREVHRSEHVSPRVATGHTAPRTFTRPPAPTPHAEPRAEPPPERSDRSDSRGAGRDRPRQFHEN